MKTKTLLGTIALSLCVAAPAPAAESGRRAEAGFGGKPLAPIAIEWEFGSEPAIGQVLEIDLAITPGVELRGGRLTLGADDPLALLEPAAELELGDLPAGEATVVEISVLPLIDQVHYLDVVVSGDSGGQRQTRAIAIAIRLSAGEARKPEAPAPAQRTGSESVQSLPAVETVY